MRRLTRFMAAVMGAFEVNREYVFGNRVAGGELDRVYQGKREPDHRTSE